MTKKVNIWIQRLIIHSTTYFLIDTKMFNEDTSKAKENIYSDLIYYFVYYLDPPNEFKD